MMQQLRKKTRLVLFIALGGFAGLIFFQWGLDITGIKTPPKTDIAKIDGAPVSFRDYLRFAQNLERERRGISEDEIWTAMIDQVVWNNLIRKAGIRVTDEEIWTIIRNNPPREIYESEYMRDENGEFDFNKYYELLRSPQSRQWLLQYEFSLREQLPREKLRSLLATMTWVSPFEDSLMITLLTARYDLSFISIPLFRLRHFVEISDDEMKEYYKKNIDDFKIPESKVLKYVLFEKVPTYEDTLETKERMEDIILQIKEEGEDFLTIAQGVSEDSLLEYNFKKIKDLPPYLQNVYKNLKNGAVSEIITTPRGFEIIKKVRRGLIYSIKFNVQISPTTLSELYDKIIVFKETAQEYGFDQAGVDLAMIIHKTYPLNRNNMNLPLRNPDDLAKFLSSAHEDDISNPLSGYESYYLFMVDSIIPEFTPKFEEFASRIKMDIERKKLKEELKRYLDNLSNQLMVGERMESVAAKDTLITFHNNARGLTLTQIQQDYGDKFAGVAATLEPDQISQPLLTEWAGYIIRCDVKTMSPFDSTMVLPLQIKRQMRMQQLTWSLITPKEVEDYRDDFFK